MDGDTLQEAECRPVVQSADVGDLVNVSTLNLSNFGKRWPGWQLRTVAPHSVYTGNARAMQPWTAEGD